MPVIISSSHHCSTIDSFHGNAERTSDGAFLSFQRNVYRCRADRAMLSQDKKINPTGFPMNSSQALRLRDHELPSPRRVSTRSENRANGQEPSTWIEGLTACTCSIFSQAATAVARYQHCSSAHRHSQAARLSQMLSSFSTLQGEVMVHHLFSLSGLSPYLESSVELKGTSPQPDAYRT